MRRCRSCPPRSRSAAEVVSLVLGLPADHEVRLRSDATRYGHEVLASSGSAQELEVVVRALRPGAAVVSASPQYLTPRVLAARRMAEAGVPGFDISTWYAFFGPAKMDPKVVEKLNQAFVKAIKSKPMAERFDKMGAVEKAGTPAQLNDFVKAELVKYKEIVKTSGAKVD